MKLKYSFNNLVNRKNEVDWELFDKIQNDFFTKNTKYSLKTRPEKHPGESTTWEHIKNVVATAKKISLPLGIKRRTLVLAALFHDIGKPYRNPDHGFDSAKIMDKLFKKEGDFNLIRFVVRHHMIPPEMPEKYFKNVVLDSKKKKLNTKKVIKLILTLNRADIIRNRKMIDIDTFSKKTIKETIREETKIKKKLFLDALNELRKE